jgi:hypothetical protein
VLCKQKQSGRHSLFSLLDTQDAVTAQWVVAYLDGDIPRWWTRWLKKGYQHVQLWGRVAYGDGDDCFWVLVDPDLELVRTCVDFDPTPPWQRPGISHTQIVTAIRPRDKIREWFSIGPLSCVELVKAYLGINAQFVRTPWQLHEHIRKRNFILR